MNRPNKKLQSRNMVIDCIVILSSVLFLTVGYSAFSDRLDMGNVSALVKAQKVIRITDVTVTDTSGNATSTYADYDNANMTSSINLPNSNSSVTYDVKITNMGNVLIGLKEITGLPSNLTYSIANYNLKDTLCDDTYPSVCTLTSVSKLSITIGYDTNGYNSGNTTYSLDLNFIFSQVYTITYQGFANTSSLATTILEGDSQVITFNNITAIPYDVLVQNAMGVYNNPTLTLSNPTNNVVITRYYGITYNLDGGSNDNNNPDKYLPADVIILSDPTKTGYVFGGWYSNSSYTGSAITSIVNGSSDLILYARWDNTITYVLNGGEQAQGQIETYNASTPVTLLEPTRSGYEFAGWYEDPNDLNTKIESTGDLVGNATLYAKWALIYTIDYILNDDGGNDSSLLKWYSSAKDRTLVNAINSHDAVFEGWYLNNVKKTTTSELSGNVTLTANWVSGFQYADFNYQDNRFTANNLPSTLRLDDFTTLQNYQYTRDAASTDVTAVQIFITYTTGNAAPSLQCQIAGGSSSGSTTFNFTRRQSNYTINSTINLTNAISSGSSYTVNCYSYSNDGNGNNKAKINAFAFIINP